MLKFRKCIDYGVGGGLIFGVIPMALFSTSTNIYFLFFCLFVCLVACRSVIPNASDAEAFIPKDKLINGKVVVPPNYWVQPAPRPAAWYKE